MMPVLRVVVLVLTVLLRDGVMAGLDVWVVNVPGFVNVTNPDGH